MSQFTITQQYEYTGLGHATATPGTAARYSHLGHCEAHNIHWFFSALLACFFRQSIFQSPITELKPSLQIKTCEMKALLLFLLTGVLAVCSSAFIVPITFPAFSSRSASRLAITPLKSSSKSEKYLNVDMNTYNIPYEDAIEQWAAEVRPKSVFLDEGIYLGARDRKNIFPDTESFDVFRKANPQGGLGVELLEIAGGREDGIGITVITGFVPGGNANTSGILPGDSITSIVVMDRNEKVFTEPIVTECLGYDKTVERMLELPSDWEHLKVTVKRLRRKPKVKVELLFPPEQNEPDQIIELFAGENLRQAMLVRGVKLNDALSRRFDSGGSGNCGAEGLCATCVVSILQGGHLLNPQNVQEKQMLAKNPRWRLACRAIVGYGQKEGTLKLKVNPRQW